MKEGGSVTGDELLVERAGPVLLLPLVLPLLLPLSLQPAAGDATLVKRLQTKDTPPVHRRAETGRSVSRRGGVSLKQASGCGQKPLLLLLMLCL